MASDDDSPQEQIRARLFDPEDTAEQAATQLFESAITDADGEDDNEDIRWLREQRLNHKTAIWYKRPTLPLLCFSLLLFFTAAGVGISVRVVLMLDVVCRHIGEFDKLTTCHSAKVQEIASSLQSLCVFTTGLSSALISGKVGELSDRFGRKPVLIFLAFFTLLSKIAALYVFQPSVPFHRYSFVFLAFLESIGGGNVVLMSVASSYVTDIVESHERIVALGFVTGSLYTGLAIGPLLGSLFIRQTGSNFSVLYLETGLAILFFLLVAFALQESRSEKFRTRSQSVHLQRKASFASQLSQQSSSLPFNHYAYLRRLIDIVSPLKRLWIPRHKYLGLAPRINVLLLIFIDSLLMVATLSLIAPLILYTTFMFDWTSEYIGYYVSVIGFSKTFVLYVFAPIFFHFLKKIFTNNPKGVDYIDLVVIIYGAVNEFLSPLLIISATGSSTIFASAIFSSFGAVALPTLQAAIIKYVPEGNVGEVFGALSLVKNIIVMAGPPGFLYLYSATVSFEPKFVFYLSAFFIIIGGSATFFLRVSSKDEYAVSVSNSNLDVESSPETRLFSTETPRRNTYGSLRDLREPPSPSK